VAQLAQSLVAADIAWEGIRGAADNGERASAMVHRKVSFNKSIPQTRQSVTQFAKRKMLAADARRYGYLSSGNLTKNRRNPTSQAPNSGHKSSNGVLSPTWKKKNPDPLVCGGLFLV
jgi:hypothetical protein